MQQKQDIIIQYYREGMSQRQIAQKTGLHRRTVKKYIASYQIARKNLFKAEVGDRITEIDLIADIVEPPAYHVSNRQKRVLTSEMVEKIQGYLAENERKKQIGQVNSARRSSTCIRLCSKKTLKLAIQR
ncbi:MAG: Integrase catalytic region [Firmicutes bacterium]|nr:Integrase catalytic region [Bacillota bacterium]